MIDPATVVEAARGRPLVTLAVAGVGIIAVDAYADLGVRQALVANLRWLVVAVAGFTLGIHVARSGGVGVFLPPVENLTPFSGVAAGFVTDAFNSQNILNHSYQVDWWRVG